MDLILKVKFWIAHVKFNRMVIFQSLAQFPVDHLSQLVMPGFRFCDIFAALSYQVINRHYIFLQII